MNHLTIIAKSATIPQRFRKVIGRIRDEPNGTIGHLQGLTDFLEVGVRSRYLLGNASAPWYGGAAVLTTDFITKNPVGTKKYIAGMKRGFNETRKNLNAAREAYTSYTSYDPKLVEAILPISYTLFDEFTPSETQYFQDNFDLFYSKNILTRKLSVAGMLYKA